MEVRASLIQKRLQQNRSKVKFEVDARSLPNVDSVSLKGSFNPDSGKFDPEWNKGASIPMADDGKNGDQKAGDGIFTRQVELQGDVGSHFWWGAVDQKGRYLVTTEQDPQLSLSAKGEQTERLSPIQLQRYGLQTGDNGAHVRAWSPSASSMNVQLFNSNGEAIRTIPMKRPDNARQDEGADWVADLGGSIEELDRHSYLLQEVDANGKVTQYIDPFARKLVGQQKGLERVFIDPIGGFETGWYDDSGSGGPNYTDNLQMGRFSVDGRHGADEMRLVLKDQDGRSLTRQQLQERLGDPGFTTYENARPEDRQDWDRLTNWKLDKTTSLKPYMAGTNINADGSISLHRTEEGTGDGGWMGLVQNFNSLEGLKYEFHALSDGKLIADLDGDGSLSRSELARTAYNENENIISDRPGSARRTLISSQNYEPKYFDSPRIESDPAKQVIYELHVGSFLTKTDNAQPATFEDLEQRLNYFTDMGFTALELMPTQEFGGKKDWGYTPDHYFAGTDGYGFSIPVEKAREEGLLAADSEHKAGEEVFINGTDAVKWFVDKAHQKGLNVYSDVVYNHTSGKADGDNPLHALGGENSDFFRWPDGSFNSTPWGRKPDFSDPFVKQFFTDHSASQLTEYGFDGIRFDFTQVLHNTGDNFQRKEGMDTLRQIQRGLELVRPGNFTVAEDFSGDPMVASPMDWARWEQHPGGMERKGMGFDAVWNDRFRDDVYEFVEGKEHGADRLMDALLNHHGVNGWGQAVLYGHSHDEVGNSGQWLGRAAAHSKEDEAVLSGPARAKARSGAALTLLGPGVPMIWQGEESLANNDFKHGLTSTWGQDTDWIDGDSAAKSTAVSQARQGHHKAYKDLISVRRSSDAFLPEAPIKRVMTHNGDRVLAFERQGASGDRFVVITHLGDQDRPGYGVPLPAGRWKEVFNSDGEQYGGNNVGNGGGVVEARTGATSAVTLPAGGTVVLKLEN
jgi:maltooligosyltrehalose trehalohydrolase